MKDWAVLADDETVTRVAAILPASGMEVYVTENGEAAKAKVLSLIPQGAEVMTMSSQTLEAIGVTQEINESGKYVSVKQKLSAMDRNTQGPEMRKIGGAPLWAVGSIHALTIDGKAMIASNSGSQLGAYAYGASHVIWVVGTQKIVTNVEEGLQRIYEYCLLLESERMRTRGVAGSNVSKILIINKETRPSRITLILVKEKLGF